MNPLTGKPAHLNPSSGPFSYTCPHLGMLDDPSTVTLFPSDANYCAYCKQPAIPNYAHQSTYCLTQAYTTCPLKQGTRPDRMPAKLRWNKYTGFNRAAFLKGALGGAIALLLALFFILWMPGIISDLLLSLAPTSVSGGNWPTLTPSLTPSHTHTPSITSTSTDSPAPRYTATRRHTATTLPTLLSLTETLAPSATATRYRSPTPTYTYTPPPPKPPAPSTTPTKRPNTAVPTATMVPPTNTPVPPTNTPETPTMPATQVGTPTDSPTARPTQP